MAGSVRPVRAGEAGDLDAARAGDETAFTALVEPYRGELIAHCYRMLGSLHDAEDAFQEAMLRAWRAIGNFEGRSSLRSWLYTIATNTCLSAIERRKPRLHPIDYGPRTDPEDGVPGMPAAETVWIEPFPDERILVEDGPMAPEARYEAREAVELAFIAALQHLPPNQRAALILREVLGFSAKETAEALDTSTQSVNSALQRARKTVEEKLPEQSQQQTLRELGDDRVSELVTEYMEAWERTDVDKVVEMLSEDAAFSMPPLGTWFRGEEIEAFLRYSPMSGDWRWKPRRVRANGQEALAFYAWDDDQKAYMPFALNVLAFEGERISDVTAFLITSPPEEDDREAIMRMPERDVDERALEVAFEVFGLPDRLD
jgi:RNA polymerase sigma-70 factor (ECF subfamily)